MQIVKFNVGDNILMKKLESGNMSLDESLASFEKAIGLVKLCNERLESADRRVRLLIEETDSSVTDADFDLTSDET